jgi:hypothetical protein
VQQATTVVVIGGLITSTLLSLLVVPVVFELIEVVKERIIPHYIVTTGNGDTPFASRRFGLSANASTGSVKS